MTGSMPLIDLPDEGIVMDDGVRLSARLWRPDAPGRFPAILEFIPYRKSDGTRARDERMHPFWAAQGYACLRVDLRGSGDSGGLLQDEYTARELADACAVIAWAAAQDWCSGAVGMMGKSWGAFNALQTAALAPPALKAVIAVCGTTDRFADDIHFKGGCLMGENLGWAATMLSYSSRPPDPGLRPDWRAVWLERLAAQPFHAPHWAAHQARDAYWRHGSVCEDWGAIRAPVLAIGGWADGYMNMVPALLENLRVPCKGILGPWVHQYPHTAVPAPRIGFLQVALRWWDRWLKDVPNGAEADPALRAWVQHSAPPDPSAPARPGRWVAEGAWPGPRIAARVMGLAPGRLGQAAPLPGLALRSPQDLGLAAGEYFPMGLDAEMPGDQAGEDARSVCFDGEVLAGPLTLLGRPVLRLRLASDSPRAHLVARLCDVAPDGASTRIAHGFLNLCHRDDPALPSDVPVGAPLDIVLRLDACGHRLAAGHRLRLALSTACWPFVWPAARDATLTLLAGSLELPVHAGAGEDEWSPPPPVVPAPLSVVQADPPRAARRIERDLLTGAVALVVEGDTGRSLHPGGRSVAESTRERWTIHPDDPLSARAEIVWQQRHAGQGWQAETEAHVAMSCTADAFRMTATLVARDGGAEVFRRDWDETVPRDWA